MDSVIGVIIEALRVIGGLLRRGLFRIKWEDSNDGVDTAIGLVALSGITSVAIWLAVRFW